MKSLLLFLCLTVCSISLKAQESNDKLTATGKVVDMKGQPLVGATVVMLQPSDSVLVGYSITNNMGLFTIKNLPRNMYVMQVSYLGFLNVSEALDLTADKPVIQIPDIELKEQSLELNEVQISAEHIPIMLKKDTIEYNAAAFKTSANAKVDELLKKLPGVEIDQNGNIKAQGKEVNRIYVDGKEFFGDDPQIATKNLPADAIDKVQVFDKMSDLAEFTGIDDGERAKSINLTLKKDHKKGYFGNVSGGYGTDERFEGKINLNKFTDNTQFSVLGSANNTNAQNFSIQDYINFSGGLRGLSSSSGGGMSISIDGGGFGGGGNKGITNSQSLGFNFNTDLSKSTELRSSYFFNGISNSLISNTFTQNLLQNESFTTQSSANNQTENYAHNLNLRLKHTWNNQEISLRGKVKYNKGNVSDISDRSTFNSSKVIENSTLYNNESTGDKLSINSNLYYRKKFKKAGRSLVTNLSLSNNNDEKEASISSENSFFDSNIINQLTAINQEQEQSDRQFDYGIRLSFIEPLGGRKYLGINYSNQNFTNDYQKNFYDLKLVRRELNTDLSNSYGKSYNYHRMGAKLLVNKKKSTTTLGFEAQSSRLNGDISSSETSINKDFFNYLPYVRWNYEFSSAASLKVNYNTRVREPSLRQLQPVIDNSDPLNQYVGNPDLDQEYTHNLRLDYSLFNMFNFTNLFVSLNAAYTKDKITNTRTVDENFVQIIAPVNVDYDYSLKSYMSFSTPIRAIGSKINIDFESTYTNGILFVNGVENKTTRLENTYDISLENRKKKVFDLLGGFSVSRNNATYSESEINNQGFFKFKYYANLSVDFLKKWTIRSDFYVERYGAEVFVGSPVIPIWNAYISRDIMKYDRGQLKLYVFDILNKNQGVSRVNELNYVSDERYNAQSQYFMFSFAYSISGFGKHKG